MHRRGFFGLLIAPFIARFLPTSTPPQVVEAVPDAFFRPKPLFEPKYYEISVPFEPLATENGSAFLALFQADCQRAAESMADWFDRQIFREATDGAEGPPQ